MGYHSDGHFSASNINLFSAAAGAAAENSASKKVEKCSMLPECYVFVPLAFETMGPVCTEGSDFIGKVGRKLQNISGDTRETSFLWQRISMAVQRFNAVCILGTFQEPQDA